jgi:DNA-binding NtrC family response regulator
LPALAERREDIPLLLEHFLTTRQIGKQRHQIDPNAMRILTNYGWPGNIRELANVIERAQILAEGNTITIDDLPESLISVPIHSSLPAQTSESPNPETLEEVERRHVQKMLSQHHGNKVHASKALGISRRALYRLIEKYRLDDSKEPEK